MLRTVLPPPFGQLILPDVPNWAWHEYGMRVGFWRFLEVLNKFNLKATLAINGSVCKSYPRVAQAGVGTGVEFMGDGGLERVVLGKNVELRGCRIILKKKKNVSM